MITYQEDGSFYTKDVIVTENYYQDPNDPTHYIPKFEPCKHRTFECRTGTCGRKWGIWQCRLFKNTITVSVCRTCEKREATGV